MKGWRPRGRNLVAISNSGATCVLAADLCFVGFPIAGTGYDVEAFARAAANFIATTGKPLVRSVPQEAVAAPFVKVGVPVFGSDRQALQALHQLAAHTEMMRQGREPGRAKPAVTSLTANGEPREKDTSERRP